MHKFFIYPGNYSELIREGLLRRENWVEEHNKPSAFKNCQFIWKPTNLSVAGYNKLDGIIRSRPKSSLQVFNHFENVRGICTKTGLVRSLKKYYQNLKEASNVDYTVFDSMPTSFIITAGVDDHEYSVFASRFKELEKNNSLYEKLPEKHCSANIWLVKPADLNQGRGIQIFRNLKDIQNFLNGRSFHSFWVVQKYIERPLLYNERKFDIRIWVLITHKNEIFFYKKAYIRTSSDNFDLDNKNNYVHLTNNCLQQHGGNYGRHEEGNTLPWEVLDQYFEQKYPGRGVNLNSHIIPRIKDLIIDTFLCVRPELNPLHRPNVFELFGYDFMIDEDLRTWLIEVNTNPYLGTPNEYIGNLLPKMIDDMLEITTDKLFVPKVNCRNERPNEFELIYCENSSQYHKGSYSARSPFSQSVYPFEDLKPVDIKQKADAMQKRREAKSTQNKSIKPPENSKSTPINLTKAKAIEKENKTLPEKVEQAAGDEEPSVEIVKKEKENMINQTASQNEEVEFQEELEIDSSFEQEFTQATATKFHRPKRSKSKTKKNNIEAIYKNLHLACVYKTSLESNILSKDLNIVLSCLKNWELISEKKNRIACKALKLIAQSTANFLLAENKPVEILTKLLRSSNVGLDIKLSIVETINFISKEEPLRKKLINTKIIHELIKISLYSCSETEIQNYSKLMFVTTLRCLINLGVSYFKKPHSLAEAKEFEKVKASYMGQGALLAIWIIAYHSLDLNMREIAYRNFLINVDYHSFERQIEILEVLKIIPEANSEHEDSDIEDFNKISEIFNTDREDETNRDQVNETKLQDPDVSTIPYEAMLHSNVNIHHLDKLHSSKNGLVNNDLTNPISFPKSLLKIYSLDKLGNEFREYLSGIRDLREIEEREKRLSRDFEKMNKEDRRRFSPADDSHKNHTPKVYKKLKEKLRIDQLPAYPKSRKEASPSRLQEKSSNSYPVVYKRGTSLDYNKKLPETIEKLIRGREKPPAESDFETSFSKTKGPSNQTGKKMTKAWDIKMKPKGPQTSRGLFVSNNHMSRIENHLYTSTIKPSFARQHNRTSSEIENRASQERQPNLRNKFPDIHRKSDKKLRSSVPLEDSNAQKPEIILVQEQVEKEDSSKMTQKQLNFIYPRLFNSEIKDQLYGKKENLTNSAKIDMETVAKLINNRNLFPKKYFVVPSPRKTNN